jgi:hypothetical protein
MNHFIEALGLSRFTLYMQDYGGPVGFRMALAVSMKLTPRSTACRNTRIDFARSPYVLLIRRPF